MIKANFAYTSIIKKFIILLCKDKNAKFDITNYQYLVKKLIYLL